MIRSLSSLVIAIWLGFAVATASAGAVSASADDGIALPDGPAAHLWLLPKISSRSDADAILIPRPMQIAAREFAPLVDRVLHSLERHSRIDAPFHGPARRLPPARASDDPPIA